GINILIATGSEPIIPSIEGIDHAGILTSTDLLNPADHPFEHLCIIGGGVIGCEFANLYANLGKQVTVIEAMPRILPEMDSEISQNLSMLMKRRKMSILTSSKVTKLEPGIVWIGDKAVECDAILMAVGRRSQCHDLFAEGLIEMDHHSIKVDESFRTSLEQVYACGDCVHGIQLAHYAAACAEHIVETAVLGRSDIHLEAVPACVYLNDEIAAVGMTEIQAKEQGIAYRIGRYSMLGNSRTIIEKRDRGFIKVLSREDGTVLGACMMCARASDQIELFTDAIAHHRTVQELAALIYPHPSFCEGIREALEDTVKDAIHIIYRH
ncbi:MAG: NAD(P)/FAD-dependent oxidoreductase, partial [Erysipelotrichia bacterium]|nr:NAD(P)/FAD-dependent oxidoreductase [Erysipelotrichia bacterium]